MMDLYHTLNLVLALCSVIISLLSFLFTFFVKK